MSELTDDEGDPSVALVDDENYDEEEEKSTSIESVGDDRLLADNDDGEEDDGNRDDEGDGDNDDEYASTDYCTDGSSTISSSSSTTNNQPDNTRVCDCCYCEVFGHGVSPVTPTSRNFQEMRERLRKRLSKRREEQCQRLKYASSDPSTATANESRIDEGGGVPDTGGGTRVTASSPRKNKKQMPDKSNSLMGDSTIEEILKFINGGPGDKSPHNAKKTKVKCKSGSNKKNKSKSNNTNANYKDSDKTLTGQNLTHNQKSSSRDIINYPIPTKKSSQQQSQDALDQSHSHNYPHKNCKSRSEIISECSHSTASKIVHLYCSRDDVQATLVKEIGEKSQSKQKRKGHDSTAGNFANLTSRGQPEHNNMPTHHEEISPASNTSSRDSSKCRSTKEAVSFRAPQQSNQIKNISLGHNHDDTISDINNDTGDEVSFERYENLSGVQREESVVSIENELCEMIATVSDDVFEPRDIDFDDDKLDEFEKELEAFKRFCLDSISLVKKERVRIELTDSECFKMFDERFANTSPKLVNNHIDRSNQTAGKRKHGQYYGQDLQKYRLVPQNG